MLPYESCSPLIEYIGELIYEPTVESRAWVPFIAVVSAQ